MSWKHVVGWATALAALAPALVRADPDPFAPVSRTYVALDAGYHVPLTINAHSFGNAPDGQPFNWDYKFNNDWQIGVRLGRRVTPHVRVELESDIREGNIHSIQAAGAATPGGLSVNRPGEPFGLCDQTTAPPPCAKINRPSRDWATGANWMLNGIYDFAPQQRLQPFVGAGVGLYHLGFNAHFYFSGVPGPIGPTNPAVQQLQLGGSINRLTQFAVQGLAGVSYHWKRRVWLDLTTRYLEAPNLRWNTLNDTPPLTPTQGLQPHDFKGAAGDVSVTLGLRYAL